MSVTIKTRDVGDVQDRRGGIYRKLLEELNEDWIKKNLWIEDE